MNEYNSENSPQCNFIIVILFYSLIPLLGCCQKNTDEFLIFKKVPKEQLNSVTDFYQGLKVRNRFFNLLVRQLQYADKQIVVIFTKNVEIAGFTITDDSGFRMYFHSVEEFLKENNLIEEFFHAYQACFYGEQQFISMRDGKSAGAANLEFEARLFKILISLDQDKTIAETPSQKGLLEFALGLVDENGRLKSYKLNEVQHLQYIELVKYFRQHWKNRNHFEGKSSLYELPVDSTLNPEACFYLLKLYKQK